MRVQHNRPRQLTVTLFHLDPTPVAASVMPFLECPEDYSMGTLYNNQAFEVCVGGCVCVAAALALA
jgi:hypothetical protein